MSEESLSEKIEKSYDRRDAKFKFNDVRSAVLRLKGMFVGKHKVLGMDVVEEINEIFGEELSK